MSTTTKIEWTDSTWNFVRGCTRVSDGCLRCYIDRTPPFRMSHNRFDSPDIGGKTRVTLHPDKLNDPLKWRTPRRVFVNSLSDLFHKDVPDELIAKAFAVMAKTPQHSYQILTKRAGRMHHLLGDDGQAMLEATRDEETADALYSAGWPLPNVWMGVSVEDQRAANLRIPKLLDTPAAVRFLSCEPLLSELDLSRWLEDSDGAAAQQRERRVSGRGDGRADDRLAGQSLAGGRETGRPVDWDNPSHSLRSAASREAVGQVSASPGDVRRHPLRGYGASAGLASLLRADSRGLDDQPQERRPQGQLAVEPGTGDICGAGQSRTQRVEAWSAGSVRNAERDGEVVDGGCATDLLASGIGRTPHSDSGGLRSGDADGIEDRQGRPSISWLICGGESGPGARPMDLAWASSLVMQCQVAAVPVFVKQLGSVWAKANGALDRKGGDPEEWPAELRIRQYPRAAVSS